jgi:hypothetical protein
MDAELTPEKASPRTSYGAHGAVERPGHDRLRRRAGSDQDCIRRHGSEEDDVEGQTPGDRVAAVGAVGSEIDVRTSAQVANTFSIPRASSVFLR